MTDVIKSILAGIAATPIILMLTIGVGVASGLNPHFLLVSVIITNIFGILFNRNSSDFFNIGAGLVVLMFTYQNTIGIESGYPQTFIMFAIPATVFTILSCLPINYLLVPNRVIAILTFGIGFIVILKQLPYAFAYTPPPHTDFSFAGEERSFLGTSTVSNWGQLALALSIPIGALIGHRFKKGVIALFLATFLSFSLGYLLEYDTGLIQNEMLLFNKPFQLNWTFSPEIIYSSLQHGITITIVMLISFWADFSTLNHDQNTKRTIKKSLRIVGIGNLIGGLFGVMPTNISLIDSFSIRAFGGKRWISKLAIILTLMVIAIVGIPNFNVPLFAFAGVLIYIGILLVIKAWQLLKELHWIDYVFTVIIGSIIAVRDYTIGFVLAIIYALVFYLITRWKQKDRTHKKFD